MKTALGHKFFQSGYLATLARFIPSLKHLLDRPYSWLLILFCLSTVPLSADIVINEILYRQSSTTSAVNNDEFVEIYNNGNSAVDISGWKITDGNPADSFSYTFPAPPVDTVILNAGEYAVVWIGNNTPDHQAPNAAIQGWSEQGAQLNNIGDDVQLFNENSILIDYVSYGSSGAVDPPPLASLWDDTYKNSLKNADKGQSISLTPNGVDGNTSACWEKTGSGDAAPRCPDALITTDTDDTVIVAALRNTSVGGDNNNLPILTLKKTVINDSGGNAIDTDFALTATGPDTITGVEGSSTITNARVNTGVYALSEANLAGYNAGNWSCTEGSLSGSNLTLALGDKAICAIINEDQPQLSIDNVTKNEGDAGNTSFTFTISIDQTSTNDITVDYATAVGAFGIGAIAATANVDYSTTSSTATITAGLTSTTVVIDVIGDNTVESDETFAVNLSNASGATVLDSQGIGTISNDDAAHISINDIALSEGNSGNTTNYSFTIKIDNPSDTDITVDYTTANVSAIAGEDYTAASGTATIPAGATSVPIDISVTGDNKVESDETFEVNLSNPSGATISDAQGIGTISNDDIAHININDISHAEGNGGNTAYTFTITIDNPSDSNITVDYATANGSATTGDTDYTATSGTATITAGTTSTTVVINAIGDTKVENDETFEVNLSSPSGATVSDAKGIGTITNDDAAHISIDNIAHPEGNSGSNTSYSFTIKIDNPSDTNITVDYTTANISATAGEDYVATSGTATIPAGATSISVVINVTGDNKVESDETFEVNLSNPSGATISDAKGIGTITNDDSALITINDVSELEGNGGNTSYSFTITINNPSDTDITVDYATADIDAVAGVDYISKTSSATIVAGDTSTQITVQSIGDLLVESDETFAVNLSNPVGATISDNKGIATITNDDAAGYTVTPASITVDEGNTDTFAVVLTKQPINDVVINLVSADTGAVGLSLTSLTFTNANWNTPQTVTITGKEDADLDDENVAITTSVDNASDAAFTPLADKNVNITVIDDDIDTDGDGVPDENDGDDDNDGTPDILDPNPSQPIASDDTINEAAIGRKITVNVLSNDDFVPAAGITITNTGNGSAAGTVVIDQATGEISYTPVNAERGMQVTIEYQVCNTNVNPAVCATAFITVFVSNAPPAPIPTLSEWMLMILALLLLLTGIRQSQIKL